MAKSLGMLFGIVFLAVGILGFVPGVTKDEMLLVRGAMLQAGAAAAMNTAPDGTVQSPFFVAKDQPGLWVTLRPLLPDRASCKGEYLF